VKFLPCAAATLALVAGVCGGCDGRTPVPQGTVLGAASAPAAKAAPRMCFTDVTAESGVTTVTWCGRREKPHLLESCGNGIALLDYDGDGDLDLYLVSGWRVDGTSVAERAKCALWRNKGDGTFEDVTSEAGVGNGGWGTGVAVGDYDGDGRPDLLVTNFGPDVLYHNDGNGRFTAVPDFHGIDGWSTGACFFDADGDGDLDLYIAGYVDCTLDEVLNAKPTLDWKGAKVMLGPFGLKGLADQFFRNDGGKFVLATKEAGLTDVGDYYGFAVAAFDVDGDGALDLYVANDSNPQYLYRNDGHGRFKETGLWCGAGLSASGASQAGMGIGVCDFDGNGAPDFCLSTFADDSATLYRNLGRGLFRDVSAEAGVRDPTFRPLKWGVVFADFDLDGDEDAFVACGHIYPQADDAPESRTSFAQPNLLLENSGGRFRDATAEAGPGLALVKVSHGASAGDIDGDGDVDLVVSNVDSTPTVLRNDTPHDRHWLLVDAPGALRVEVEAGGRTQTRFFVAGGSFCSVSDPRFHFGLAGASSAARVKVTWQRGGETVLTDVAADRVVRVKRP
jgi:enediyne biosynthesis protein E4